MYVYFVGVQELSLKRAVFIPKIFASKRVFLTKIHIFYAVM